MNIRLRTVQAVALAACMLAIWISTGIGAAPLKEARVTQVIKDVKLVASNASPRPASLNDRVQDRTAVRTGVESRAELAFTDQTLVRLGANTVFSFNQGTRDMNLGDGAMLLQVPERARGAKIRAGTITAAITGTTCVVDRYANAYFKFMLFQGEARLYLAHHIGESLVLHAGQMLIVNPNARNLPDPVDFNLDLALKTCRLIIDYPHLPSWNLMVDANNRQLHERARGALIDTNVVSFGRGTLFTLVDPATLNNGSQKSSAAPAPAPVPTSNPSPSPALTANPAPAINPSD